MKQMFDCDGNLLDVGDTIAYVEAGYTSLHRAVITGFTAMQVKVGSQEYQKKLRYPQDVVKLLNLNKEKK